MTYFQKCANMWWLSTYPKEMHYEFWIYPPIRFLYSCFYLLINPKDLHINKFFFANQETISWDNLLPMRWWLGRLSTGARQLWSLPTGYNRVHGKIIHFNHSLFRLIMEQTILNAEITVPLSTGYRSWVHVCWLAFPIFITCFEFGHSILMGLSHHKEDNNATVVS